jgi:hypothetical protein
VDCGDLDTKTVVGAAALLWWLVSSLVRGARRMSGGQSQPAPAPEPVMEGQDWEEEEEKAATPEPQAHTLSPPTDALAAFRDEWLERGDRLETRAARMEARIVHEPPNRPFREFLRDFVPREVYRARGELKDQDPTVVEAGAARVQDTEYLLEVVAYLAEQRRDEQLVPMLGDADRLAEACYRPVLTFARSQGVGVASNHPVSVLGNFELAIWSGLIPTSIAPIFLPRGFFDSAIWWPAIPHEIGHDFYASIEGFDAGLREELGLADEREGARLIRASDGSVNVEEIRRVFSVWVEELFCDVFATMMTGSAYVVSMLELFASPHDPAAVVSAGLMGGGYDHHPPRHLRFLMACDILTRLGFKADVADLRAQWETIHGGAENLQEILLPTDVGYLGFPSQLFVDQASGFAEQIVRGPIKALRGRGLSGVAGLDYGPHRHNESKRACAALLRGEVPAVRDVRAVVAGAALAAHEAPEHESQILALAREAIPAKGTRETRPASVRQQGGLELGVVDARAVVQALVVGEIMNRHSRLRR